MFADDTNLFYSGKDIHSLFNNVNNELSNISHWFNNNKLALNADKTKFTLFHNVRKRGNIPLVENVFLRRKSKMEKSYKFY